MMMPTTQSAMCALYSSQIYHSPVRAVSISSQCAMRKSPIRKL